MEPSAFAIALLRKACREQDTTVPEPAEFRPFDLQALKRSYQAEANSSSSPSLRQKSLTTQAAS